MWEILLLSFLKRVRVKALVCALLMHMTLTHANTNDSTLLGYIKQLPSQEISLKATKKISNADTCLTGNKVASRVSGCRHGEVATANAAWLFLTALIGFVFLINKRS